MRTTTFALVACFLALVGSNAVLAVRAPSDDICKYGCGSESIQAAEQTLAVRSPPPPAPTPTEEVCSFGCRTKFAEATAAESDPDP